MIVAHPGEIVDKKKFLFVSLDGLIADIAWQVVKEGHEVKLFTESKEERKKAGVSIIPQENFHSFDEAIAFVRANPNRYVIKPSGEAQNLKQLLFVGEDEDGKDVIQVLEDYQRAWADRVKAFQLQRRIVGVEVAAGGFFN